MTTTNATLEAIQTSARENRTVTIQHSVEAEETLCAECDDNTDMVDFWGEVDGAEWRVRLTK